MYHLMEENLHCIVKPGGGRKSACSSSTKNEDDCWKDYLVLCHFALFRLGISALQPGSCTTYMMYVRRTWIKHAAERSTSERKQVAHTRESSTTPHHKRPPGYRRDVHLYPCRKGAVLSGEHALKYLDYPYYMAPYPAITRILWRFWSSSCKRIADYVTMIIVVKTIHICAISSIRERFQRVEESWTTIVPPCERVRCIV